MDQNLIFDAVILAGGRATRLGGVAKGEVRLRGERLLDRVLAAVSQAKTRVVVGEIEVPVDVLLTREDPPFTGPAAGCLAGLAVITNPSDWVLLLACDLADSASVIPELLQNLPTEKDGVCLLGPDGRRQWLLGGYRRSALLDRAEFLGSLENTSMRHWLDGLDLAEVPAVAATDDIDTWADHARWEGG